MSGDTAVGAAIAFTIALVTTPAGVSGAVLLLPVQVSILNVPSPGVTPTNLLYNVIATPGGLWRYWRSGALSGPLARTLVAGTLPGVILGAVIRVEYLSGPRAFLVVIACVLLPLGSWLATIGARGPSTSGDDRARISERAIFALGLAVGVVGGIYGIGGGSILSPILLALGYSVFDVAGAALAATFLTSVAGILTYQLLQLHQGGAIAPEWTLGLAMGAGGLVGGYLGARLQPRMPETLIRRSLGLIVLAVAARYLFEGIGGLR
jgi:uncharacterized membrane protein YfcA